MRIYPEFLGVIAVIFTCTSTIDLIIGAERLSFVDIGRAIRECAQERGMKQADICRATGLSDGYMSTLWRSLIDDPQIRKIRAISQAFHMSVDELLAVADRYPDIDPPR